MCTDDEAMELKRQCVDLLFDCPRNRQVPTCPFRKVREEDDVVARVNWLKGLMLVSLRRLTRQHTECCAKRG